MNPRRAPRRGRFAGRGAAWGAPVGVVLPVVLLALALLGLGAASALWLVRIRLLATRRADAADLALRRAEESVWMAMADTSAWPTSGPPVMTRRISVGDTDEVAVRPLVGAWLVVGRSTAGGVSRAVSVLVRNQGVTPAASMSPDALTRDTATSTLDTRRTPRRPLPGPAWGPWS